MDDGPTFRVWGQTAHARVPVVLAAPHGGREYPAPLLDAMRDPAQASVRLEDRYIDILAEALAQETGATLIAAHAPRAMIDLNRAEDDIDWSMISDRKPQKGSHSLANRRARMGLGLIPRRLPGSGEIWRRPITLAEIELRLEQIHRPYHRALERILQQTRDAWGVAVLLDLHSMPPLKPLDTERRSVEFVVGDRFGCSCDARLSARSLQHFAANGRLAAHNRPYSGGYVLDRHGQPRRGMHALQVEVCRSLYLDNRLEEPSARLGSVVRLLAGLVRAIADAAMTLPTTAFSQAAE